MWLLPPILLPSYNDNRVLVSDPATSCEKSFPKVVRALLQDYKTNLILAGGAVLGAVARHACCGSDYDLFIVGLDDEGAGNMLRHIRETYAHKIEKTFRSGNAVTMIIDDTIVQVILRLYDSVAEVLIGFDVAPSKVGAYYDAADQFRVVCSPAFIPALRHMAFALDTTSWGYASIARYLKYKTKGFQIYIPGHRRQAAIVDAYGLSHGLVALFRAEKMILSLRLDMPRMRSRADLLRAPLTLKEVQKAIRGLSFMSDYTIVAKINGTLRHVIRSIVKRTKEMFFGSYQPTYTDTDIDIPYVFARCDFRKKNQYAVFYPLNANVWEAYDPIKLANLLLLPD